MTILFIALVIVVVANNARVIASMAAEIEKLHEEKRDERDE